MADDYLRTFFKNTMDEFKQETDVKKVRQFEQEIPKYLPEFLDEITGFTDAVNVAYETFLYRFIYDWSANNCSQFVAFPSITANNHLYTGHNYDWSLSDEHLHIINIRPGCSFMGFSMMFFGRWNGLNEHGLSIHHNGLQGVNIENQSLFCDHIFVRILLETCKTAQEAFEVYQELPKAGGAGSLIIADTHGDAFLVNFAGPAFAYRKIGQEHSEQYLCSTNHYLLEAMWEKESFRGVHSILRYNAMNAWFEKQAAPIGLSELKAFQALTIPNGPCCHYYTDWLGTIRSMIYDLTDIQAHVCFGSPVHNAWHIYDFHKNISGVDRIITYYEDETADPKIWKRLPPGCTDIDM
jgi:predicted choloylglycine hydrolase